MRASIVVSLLDRLSGPAARMTRSLKSFERAANMGRSMQQAGARITAYGALYTSTAADLRRQGADFVQPLFALEDALATVGTIAPATFGSVEKDMGRISKAAQRWSTAHTDSAVSYVQASYQMISAGLDTRQAIAATEAGLTLARATMGDAGEAANLLATVYNTLGNKSAEATGELGRLGDIVTKTQMQFQIANLGQLQAGLQFGIPAAKQYGVSIEQLSAAVGQLNTMGLQGSLAGTAFGAAMRNMNKASKTLGFTIARTADGGVDFAATLDVIRAKYHDKMGLPEVQMAFQQAFGDEGVRAMSLLLGDLGSFRKGLDAVTMSSGTAAAAQRRVESTGSSTWRRLANQVEDLKVGIGEGLAPTLAELEPKIRRAVQWLREFVGEHPGLVKLAAGMALLTTGTLSVLGPVMLAGGLIVQAVGSSLRVFSLLGRMMTLVTAQTWLFNAALWANPLTWVVVAVVALIAAIVGLIVYWDEVSAAVGRAGSWIRETWGSLVGWFSGLWGRVVAVFQTAMTWLRKVLVKGFAILAIVMGGPVVWTIVAVTAIRKHWTRIQAFFSGLWARIKGIVSAALAGIWERLQLLPGQIMAVLGQAVEFVKSLPGVFFDAGVGLFEAMLAGLKSVATRIIRFVKDVLTEVRSYLPFSDAKVGPLSELTASGRAFATTWSAGIATGAPDVTGAIGDIGTAAIDTLRPRDLTADLRVPGFSAQPSNGVARESVAPNRPRTITVQIQQLVVQAQDVDTRDRFVEMLRDQALAHGGLAMEAG
jgi:TP901 family phage tail tape measure protein